MLSSDKHVQQHDESLLSQILVWLFCFAIFLCVAAAFFYAMLFELGAVWQLALSIGIISGLIASLTVKRFQGKVLHANVAGIKEVITIKQSIPEPKSITQEKYSYLIFYAIRDFIDCYFLFSASYGWLISATQNFAMDIIGFNPYVLLLTFGYWLSSVWFNVGTEVAENWLSIEENYTLNEKQKLTNTNKVWLPTVCKNKIYTLYGTFVHSFVEHYIAVIGCIPPEFYYYVFMAGTGYGLITVFASILIIGLPLFIETFYFDRVVYLKNADIKEEAAPIVQDIELLKQERLLLKLQKWILVPVASFFHGFSNAFAILMVAQLLLPIPFAYAIFLSVLIIVIIGNFLSEGISAMEKINGEISELDSSISDLTSNQRPPISQSAAPVPPSQPPQLSETDPPSITEGSIYHLKHYDEPTLSGADALGTSTGSTLQALNKAANNELVNSASTLTFESVKQSATTPTAYPSWKSTKTESLSIKQKTHLLTLAPSPTISSKTIHQEPSSINAQTATIAAAAA